jgi:hypothetical protein
MSGDGSQIGLFLTDMIFLKKMDLYNGINVKKSLFYVRDKDHVYFRMLSSFTE